jgi:hypothetical protein
MTEKLKLIINISAWDLPKAFIGTGTTKGRESGLDLRGWKQGLNSRSTFQAAPPYVCSLLL